MTTESNKSGKNRTRIIYIVLIIILLVINGLLFYQNLQTKEDRDEVQAENVKVVDERDALTDERDELLAEMEEFQDQLSTYEVENAAYSGRIDSMRRVIAAMQADFQKQMRNKDYNQNQLRKELEAFKVEFENMKNDYLEEIARLEKEKAALQDTLSTKNVQIEDLNKKVARAEGLSAGEVFAYGVRYRNNETEKETDRAKRVEKIMVCFNVMENRVADPGYKPILVKVTNPNGATLAVEAKGSGSFEMADGEESLFTKKININYDPSNQDKEYCTDWYEENGFEPGLYNIQLYHEGYLIGQTDLELKKGLF